MKTQNNISLLLQCTAVFKQFAGRGSAVYTSTCKSVRNANVISILVFLPEGYATHVNGGERAIREVGE
jgi:hypothetical protein